MTLELGLDTFGDITRDADGELLSDAQTIRNVVDAGRARRPGRRSRSSAWGSTTAREFAISSPEIVLAAIAARTEHIHLGTAVTVLSSR